METTITLQQQREMLTNAIAQFKAEGEQIGLSNIQCDLRKLDEAKPTGLKYKDEDGKVYEIFSWYYISQFTGGKRYMNSYYYANSWGVMRADVRKKECFK